jgi:hypothetical protein
MAYVRQVSNAVKPGGHVLEALARKEQEAIKRRIRRTAEQVKRHSKSKQ